MKIEVFFYILYIYINFLGTPCLCQLHRGRKGGSNQQCACEELQLDCIFSEGSAEVYEQPCACQLVFFQKAVQKCMNSHVHVSFLFSEASAKVHEQLCACASANICGSK